MSLLHYTKTKLPTQADATACSFNALFLSDIHHSSFPLHVCMSVFVYTTVGKVHRTGWQAVISSKLLIHICSAAHTHTHSRTHMMQWMWLQRQVNRKWADSIKRGERFQTNTGPSERNRQRRIKRESTDGRWDRKHWALRGSDYKTNWSIKRL